MFCVYNKDITIIILIIKEELHMQNKETFGLNNMNGLTENDRRSCALDDMNCIAGQESCK